MSFAQRNTQIHHEVGMTPLQKCIWAFIEATGVLLSSRLHLASQPLTALSLGSNTAACSNAIFAVSISSSSKDATLQQHSHRDCQVEAPSGVIQILDGSMANPVAAKD